MSKKDNCWITIAFERGIFNLLDRTEIKTLVDIIMDVSPNYFSDQATFMARPYTDDQLLITVIANYAPGEPAVFSNILHLKVLHDEDARQLFIDVMDKSLAWYTQNLDTA